MHFAFAIPNAAESGSGGGADYIAGLVQALRELGHRTDLLTGPSPNFPPEAVPVIDGMLLPRLDALPPKPIAIIHHVSAAAGRDDGAREKIRVIEAEMFPRLYRVIATSEPVANRLRAEFGLDPRIVPPGARDLPRAAPDDDTPLLLAVGVFTRRKGHDRLLRAAARLTDLPWRLIIAGDSGREPVHAAELAALTDELGLAHRTELLADPDPQALERAWRSAAIFALATRWEGYPSAVAEALRRGIPIVVTAEGDPGKLVPLEAGAVVPLDDAATFGKCLRRLLFDRDLRRDMADEAWRAGQRLPSWRTRAESFVTLLEN